MSLAPFANGAKGCGTPNYNGKPKNRYNLVGNCRSDVVRRQ